jgi:hypothetical protein
MDETLHPELLLEFGDETVVLATAFSQQLTKGIYNFSLRLTMRSLFPSLLLAPLPLSQPL